MWGRKSPIEEYLDKHPDSTLREYNSHKVFQISEEDFNKVVEKYNEMVKVAKEIKAT